MLPACLSVSISRQLFFCRGGFSHDNATLFGSASSAKQQDSQQLEALKPARFNPRRSAQSASSAFYSLSKPIRQQYHSCPAYRVNCFSRSVGKSLKPFLKLARHSIPLRNSFVKRKHIPPSINFSSGDPVL